MQTKSTLSFIGILLGIAFAVFSAVRYFVIWPDTDRAIVYVIIGMLISCVGWLYGRNRDLDNRLLAVEDYLSELNDKEKK